jgi:ribonuclease P protein component
MSTADAVKALLATPSRARTAHFSLHVAPFGAVAQELPTEVAPDQPETVDNMLLLVVPKRHAKRAVTRNLIKRQMRDAARRHLAGRAPQRKLVRLRSPFDPRRFSSAASPALRQAVRLELDVLFAEAGGRA